MSELTHLSSSGGEVLERPPGPLFFLCLLDLLGDLHGSFEGLRGINGTEGERERELCSGQRWRRWRKCRTDSSPVERLLETGQTRVTPSAFFT